MKKWMSLLLCIAMLLPLLAGCGAPAEETQQATQQGAQTVAQTQPTVEPTTEPTIDPEELFLQSLPADVRRAYEAGLVEREQLEDLDRTVTVGEAAAILQKAQTHRAGAESPVLADLMTHETFASRNADRGWLMGIPALIDLELAYPDLYTDYEQWTKEAISLESSYIDVRYSFGDRYGMGVYMIGEKAMWDQVNAWDMAYDPEGSLYLLNARDVIAWHAPDYFEFEENADALYVVDGVLLGYATTLHDSTTGKKFMETEDGRINPFRELTFGELVESALRLYNARNVMEKPEYLAPEEVGKYNERIITAELLSKQTTLPEASCAHLPAEWRGVSMNDLQHYGNDSMHQDTEIFEYEIQAVKDAGFNYISLSLDFSWLQDYILYDDFKNAFKNLADNADQGNLSLRRLEYLDQIIAWCMERDIHVNLRATALPNMPGNLNMTYELAFSSRNYAQPLAQIWQAIARRYADIPNEYLSFTLYSDNIAYELQMIQPSIESIRAESPDRCIIAEIDSWKTKAEDYAQLGVALSSRIWDYENVSPVFDHSECVKFEPYKGGSKDSWPEECLDSMRNFSWPYEGTIDALTLMSYRRWTKIPSCMDVMEIAKENGVGFMLGDFGVRLWEWGNLDSVTFPRFRYPMEAYKAMLRDIATTVEGLGYGWCFTYWYGPYGVAFGIPLFDDTTYTQVEDYPYYLDDTLLSFFQELNGNAAPAESAPVAAAETAVDAASLVASLKVPEDQRGYYLAAAEAGISLDNIGDEPINGREMAALLDQFVAHVAPDKLAAWQKQYFAFRASLEPLNRMDLIAAIFLAAHTAGDTQYLEPTADAFALFQQVTMDWDAEYLHWDLFGGFDNLPTFQTVDVFDDSVLDGAAHHFNQGRTNVLTGESLLDLDAATNTMRYGDEATWRDAVVALGRLLYRDNGELLKGLFPDSTWLLQGEDDAKIAEYRKLAAERKESILNSKTTIVKADTFIPGETYSGTAYYVSPNGDDSNDGLSPETAWKTTDAVTNAHRTNKLKMGDAVFFERGSTYRVDPYDGLVVHEGVTYSAYGEGAKPILTFTEGNKADPSFWELYYDQDGMKIWKYHQDITDVGGIVFNDSSYASRVWEWPDNGKWQAIDIVELAPADSGTSGPEACSPVRFVGTGEYRKVEENLPEDLTYISRVDISDAAYPMNFLNNPKTGMPYTGELYLRCDEGNPGDVFEEIAIIGYSDVRKGGCFLTISAWDTDHFVLDNLCIKYYLDTAVSGNLKSENVIIQNCEVGWGGSRIHTVESAEPTIEYFNIGDSIYNIANNATIRNNYVYQGANGCTFENGPLGYEKQLGVYTCTGNLFENTSEGVRAYLDRLDAGDVPFEKLVIQDNLILDTGISMNGGNSEIRAAIDISGGLMFAEEILVEDNICIGSTGTMLRMGNPMNVKETYRNNVWVHDSELPMAAMMNTWTNSWVTMDGAK